MKRRVFLLLIARMARDSSSTLHLTTRAYDHRQTTVLFAHAAAIGQAFIVSWRAYNNHILCMTVSLAHSLCVCVWGCVWGVHADAR